MAKSTMKNLFDTRPLKDEFWLKCKDTLTTIQMSGLETIVDGGDLPNGYKRVHLEQVIRFMISHSNLRKEEDLTNAHSVTNSPAKEDEVEELSPSTQEALFSDHNSPQDSTNAQNATKSPANEDEVEHLSPSTQEALFSAHNNPQDSSGPDATKVLDKDDEQEISVGDHPSATDVTRIPDDEKGDPLEMTKYEDSLNVSVIQVEKTPEPNNLSSKTSSCRYCNEEFVSTDDLKIHELTHNGNVQEVKSYGCNHDE